MKIVAEMVTKVLAGEVDLTLLERNVWQESLKAGREALRRVLEALDDVLLKSRPPGLKVLGRKPRSILTLMGEVTFKRRHYRDREGKHRFLLDELLRIEARCHLSPQIKEAAALLSTCLPYRAACEAMAFFAPDVPAHTTFMNHARELGEDYSREQKEGAEALFSSGELPATQGREADILFCELDGTPFNLQGEEKRKGELKLALSHEGWEERGDGEWRLKAKRIHMGVAPSRDFARTHIYDLATCWDLAGVARFVISGDGAPLAREAADLAPRSLFQLDRFHLKRAILRALATDGELASRVYELATTGGIEEALDVLERRLEDGEPEERAEIGRLLSYLLANRDGLVCYRERLKDLGDNVRGMGAIEGNIDKNVANRFKKRGMRFSARGAHSLAKVIELRHNGMLAARIKKKGKEEEAEGKREGVVRAASLIRQRLAEDPERWLKVHMPALYGPHSDEPWVKVLKGISQLSKAI